MSDGSGTHSYGDDGNGARVRQTAAGQSALYYVRSSLSGQVIGEVGATQGLSRMYVYSGGQLIAQRSYGQFYWQHQDHLGSGHKLTDTNGTVVYRGEYDPHGQMLLETGSLALNKKKFTGYERDATGLDYANARMYHHNRGRFTKPDPAGLKAADQSKPSSLNRYTYTSNDPVNQIDPSGLLTLLIHGTGDAPGDHEWALPGSDFWQAVFNTFGETPTPWYWRENASVADVSFLTGYQGIYRAGRDLADFINKYPFAEGEMLNIVAHSHGGNVVKTASWLLNRSIDNLVTLGTPQNFDLLPINPSAAKNHCNVSSLTDPLQFAGASPGQVALTGLFAYYGGRAASAAFFALFDGDFQGAAIYSSISASYFATSAAWSLTTRIDLFASNNVLLGSGSHHSLITASGWNRIEGSCGLSGLVTSRQWLASSSAGPRVSGRAVGP